MSTKYWIIQNKSESDSLGQPRFVSIQGLSAPLFAAHKFGAPAECMAYAARLGGLNQFEVMSLDEAERRVSLARGMNPRP
jgi:hypothetical protein